ncbi:MAG: hypothetical protein N3E42_05470 [Candidatus Bipolaricaulota bacterium]|nr:hypothetical protein [Candidatus Bipolaricaulota bacterium]
MDLLALIVIFVLAVGAGGATFILLRWWGRREEPTIEKLERDLKELEIKYKDLARRFKKIKALDKAQLELIKRVIQDESRKSLVSLFFMMAALIIQRFFD